MFNFKLLCSIAILCSSFSFGQNTFTFSGKVVDQLTNQGLETATVYFVRVSDSTVVDYSITDANGGFDIQVKKISYPVILKISFNGYKEYKRTFSSINQDENIGTISLEENISSLKEVLVEADIPPIVIKKDTLEFNASSFKVRPDANVESLLKQLPGLEIDAEGKITINGKEVNQVLVNGKPFFDKDGKIALQNLPSDIINKVQVTDTKTEKEEKTGAAASSNNASINLTIDEDKNKGYFGKFMGGFGSDDRYEGSLLLNYFKDKQKISLLASSNNINSSGFSMDEIFDNMGGGRNRSIWINDNGSFSINGRSFGSGQGITRTNLVGLNYADQLSKNIEANGSYFFNSNSNENVNKRNQTSFLPTGNFATSSQAITRSENETHNFSTEFEFKIDSTATITVIPDFSLNKSKLFNKSNQSSFDQNNALLNQSTNDDVTENKSTRFKNQLYFNKSFKKKGKYLSFSFENEHSNANEEDFTKSSTVFFQNAQPSDIRNQFNNSTNKANKYRSELEYLQPITDSIQLKFGINYNFENGINDRNSFDFDNSNQEYTQFNTLLSTLYENKQNELRPKTGISIQKKDYYLSFEAGPSFLSYDNYSQYLGSNTNLQRNFIIPYAQMYGNYKFSKSKSIYLNYNYSSDFPSAQQVLPIANLANPLNTVIGNVNLDLNKYHNTYFSYRNYDYTTRSGYGVYTGGNFYDNQIVTSVTFDANRKRTTSYENVSGTYSGWLGAYFNKTYKLEAHKFRLSLRLNNNIGFSKGITDGVLYTAKTTRYSPSVGLTYDYGELLTINPTYSISASDTKYTNYVIDKASNTTHNFKIQTTNYWPKNWVFGNDFGYTYNSNIANGFRKDFYLWNTSLSYSFFNKQFMAKVKVYDLLNQNLNTTRSISASTIVDEENIVLKRYVMFSLTYKLDKFGGQKKEKNRFWMM